MKKILVLRIYNSDPFYDQMKELHMKYDNSYFVTYDPTLENEWTVDGRTIKIKGNESFKPGILEKTLKALEICLDFKWDYIIRSNMSTVIDLNELQKKLENVDSIYGGHVFELKWTCDRSGITQEVLNKIYGLKFVSGSTIVMSRDICELLVKNASECNRTLIDDVSIGVFLKNIPSTHIPFSESIELVPNCCFYRFRDYSYDRSQNVIDMGLHYSNTIRGTICIASNSCAHNLTA